MNNKLNFYFPYCGNKRSEMKLINEFINLKGIKRIVEPFCGSAVFSRYCVDILKFEGEIILNDTDKTLINFLKDVKKGYTNVYVDYVNNNLKDLTKEKFKEIINKRDDDLKAWFFYHKIYNFRIGLYPEKNIIKGFDLKKFEHLDNFYKNRNVKLFCKDYKNIINKYKDDPTTLIFFDPPYFDSFNNYYSTCKTEKKVDDKYNIIDSTCMFTDIFDTMNSKTRVISVLNTPYILQYLFKQYIKKIYAKNYSLTKKNKIGSYKTKTNHMIITN